MQQLSLASVEENLVVHDRRLFEFLGDDQQGPAIREPSGRDYPGDGLFHAYLPLFPGLFRSNCKNVSAGTVLARSTERIVSERLSIMRPRRIAIGIDKAL